jgi:Fe-S cluster assembly protein SufD
MPIAPPAQIIADDVKCTHGCAVSDLSEEEMFYFRWELWISESVCLSPISDSILNMLWHAFLKLTVNSVLLYGRARGINALAARQALVSSFGAEVTQDLKLSELQARVQQDVRATLANVDLTAALA